MRMYNYALQVVVLLTVIWTVDGNLVCPTKCEEGKFMVRNCTRDSGGWRALLCQDCKKCEGEGQKVVSSCTHEADTQCGCEDGYVSLDSTSCQKATTTATTTATSMSVTTHKVPSSGMHISGAAPIFLAFTVVVFVVIVAMGECAFFEAAGSWRLQKNSNRGVMV